MPYAAVTLTDDQAQRVQAGALLLDLARVPGGTGLEAGQPVRLLDPAGVLLASGVADPENEVLRILVRGHGAFDVAFFRRRVEKAVALRRGLGLLRSDQPDESFRLVHGEGDDLSGFAVDVYGRYAVVYAYARGLVTLGHMLAEAVVAGAGLKGAVVKVRPKGGVKAGQLRQDVVGEEPPEKLIVKELGVPYEVHLMGGLNVGLFVDMREQRRTLRRFVEGRSVLNTFAYTGALSVVAAREGAREVVSVDLSSGVLKWAQENFRLSGLDPTAPQYRFEVSDVARFFTKEKQRGVRYDTIILDPPTYSTARASTWSMKEDYPPLIAQAMDLIPEGGGFLWVSTNEHRGRGVLAHVDDARRLSKRRVRILETAGLPPDHPTPPSFPEGRYLEIAHLWIDE